MGDKRTSFLGSLGVSFFAGFLALGWTALLTAEWGGFSALWSGAAFVAVCVPMMFCRKPMSTPKDRGLLLVILIALASLVTTLPVSESIHGGWDPGVYVHTAAQIADKGAILFEENDYQHLSDIERYLLTLKQYDVLVPFEAMRLTPSGQTSPQFYHLFPCVMALMWSLGGLWGALLLNPLLHIGSLLACYVVASRVLDRRWAIVAVIVLTLNPAQIWQAKFSTAELLNQFLILGGFVFLENVLGSSKGHRVEAILSGSAFGLAFLARSDTFLLLVPLAVLLIGHVRHIENKVALKLFAVVLGLFVIHVVVHQQLFCPFYRPLGKMAFIASIGIALLCGFIYFTQRSLQACRREGISSMENMVSRSCAVLFILGVAWYWLFEPSVANAPGLQAFLYRFQDIALINDIGSLVERHGTVDLRFLVYVLGPAGLIVSVLGIAVLMLESGRSSWKTIWLFSSAVVLLVYATEVFNDPFLMWVARRFVPVCIPLLAIGAAACGRWLTLQIAKRTGRDLPWIGYALVAAVLVMNGGGTLSASKHRDWPGLASWYKCVASSIPDGATVYSDQPGYAATLRYLYGIRAYELRSKSDERLKKLFGMMYLKAADGGDIRYLTMNPPPEDHPLARFEATDELPLRSSILNRRRHAMPGTERARTGDFVLYRVLPREP